MITKTDPPYSQGVSRVSSGGERRALGGLLVRKESWRLSGLGRLILAIATAALATLVFFGVYPFLAITTKVSTDTLVVEGWVHEYAIRIAAKEFKTNRYQRVFTTGGPGEGSGGYVNDFQTAASVSAEGLVKAGVAADAVQMVPSQMIGRDRTYSSAVALRNWLHDNDVFVNSFNVLTATTHARRTRLLFEEVFGGKVRVGIISIPNPDYDQRHWWRYSQGVKDVLTEGVAYIYAKFLFWPSAAESQSDFRSQRLEIAGQRTEDGRRKGKHARR
jgi:uncharacterized SAM-binding protein YcdF (DUF218 family)